MDRERAGTKMQVSEAATQFLSPAASAMQKPLLLVAFRPYGPTFKRTVLRIFCWSPAAAANKVWRAREHIPLTGMVSYRKGTSGSGYLAASKMLSLYSA